MFKFARNVKTLVSLNYLLCIHFSPSQ